MKKQLLVLLLFCSCVSGSAQHKPVFHSRNYLGINEGSSTTRMSLESVNGLQYQTWFLGLGTGLDWYYLRSIPLFLSLGKDFSRETRGLFAEADMGLNFPWKKVADENWYNSSYSSGLYANLGLGYKLGLKNGRDAFLVKLAYSYKHFTESRASGLPCLFPPCPESHDRLEYSLNRLRFQLGWQF